MYKVKKHKVSGKWCIIHEFIDYRERPERKRNLIVRDYLNKPMLWNDKHDALIFALDLSHVDNILN